MDLFEQKVEQKIYLTVKNVSYLKVDNIDNIFVNISPMCDGGTFIFPLDIN